MKRISSIALLTRRHFIRKAILKRTRKKKDIIYGARSIQKRINFFSRGTQDYDIFTGNPKKSAKEMQGKFDKIVGYNYYYAKPAQHPGTYKVKTIGKDFKKGTSDDEEVIDYSKTPRPIPRYDTFNGIRYRKLSEEIKAKKKALRDKAFAFRHPKDREDLNRIKLYKKTLGRKK